MLNLWSNIRGLLRVWVSNQYLIVKLVLKNYYLESNTETMIDPRLPKCCELGETPLINLYGSHMQTLKIIFRSIKIGQKYRTVTSSFEDWLRPKKGTNVIKGLLKQRSLLIFLAIVI